VTSETVWLNWPEILAIVLNPGLAAIPELGTGTTVVWIAIVGAGIGLMVGVGVAIDVGGRVDICGGVAGVVPVFVHPLTSKNPMTKNERIPADFHLAISLTSHD
jgi:hypothetical protein